MRATPLSAALLIVTAFHPVSAKATASTRIPGNSRETRAEIPHSAAASARTPSRRSGLTPVHMSRNSPTSSNPSKFMTVPGARVLTHARAPASPSSSALVMITPRELFSGNSDAVSSAAATPEALSRAPLERAPRNVRATGIAPTSPATPIHGHHAEKLYVDPANCAALVAMATTHTNTVTHIAAARTPIGTTWDLESR